MEDNIHRHLHSDMYDDPFDPGNYLNFAGKHHALVFFLVYIYSPDEAVRQTNLYIRSDDAVRVWLNGQEICDVKFVDERNIINYEETCAEIAINPGYNILLAAVPETHVEWRFSARIEHDEGLRFTGRNPHKFYADISPYRSQFQFISIPGDANHWNAHDPHRILSCKGNHIWKGRVKMSHEEFKFATNGDLRRHNWGADGMPNGPNFSSIMPGVYDVIFNENDPGNPLFILVKPFFS